MILLLLTMTVLKETKATRTNDLKMNDLANLVEQFVFHDYFNKDFSLVNNDFGKTAKRLNDMITVYGDRTNGKFYVRLSEAYKKISEVTFDEDLANTLVGECKRDILLLKDHNLSILKVFRELSFYMNLTSIFDGENFDLKIKAKFGWKIVDFMTEYIYVNFEDLLNRHRIIEIADTPGLALWPSSKYRPSSTVDDGETPGLNEKFDGIDLDDN
jgi:hypothetical protein